eukprot:14291810-Alexandrium_andersonii.AAC.1
MCSSSHPPARAVPGCRTGTSRAHACGGGPVFARNLAAHYDLLCRLWEGFGEVARHCKRVGAT